MNNLYEMFSKQIADLHSADCQLSCALPKIIRVVNTVSLANAFNSHLIETNERIKRIEKISQELELNLGIGSSRAMSEFLIEADSILDSNYSSHALKDAMIAALSRKVEHYLIASYSNVREISAFLGYGKISRMLNRSMQAEKRSDEGINGICITQVFPECEHDFNEQEGGVDTDQALRVRA